ncbi:hypothetical protein [Allorhodopirellula heiligendammensis]|uniref:Uncharacterized protein n=1 Tax=Allorhodopirellula heiligendammensis TaxID=2714739 RepID=A0A5C6C3X1_9BACT|nr:hypothetical protein [Allorhodopirellula heiligendammensis]TWU18858.1 hypothetical protein Poly21_10250 [Allorhodopirellula heiligendammensis]
MTRRAKPTKKFRKDDLSPSELIRSALSKCKKAELIDFLVEFSKQHLEVQRELEARLNVEKPVSLVVNDIETAIALATDFDERRMNYNFDYDHESYEAVEKGLKKLIEHGELEEAKRLSLELMKRGSYQVACSDEGLMSYEIEDCLKPVIKAVKRAGGKQAKQWAAEMIRADEVGFIGDAEFGKLAGLKS